MRVRTPLAIAILVALAVLTACSDRDVIGSNPVGTNAEAGEIPLRGIRIAPPPDSNYSPGADATLWLALINDGAEVDRLVRASSTVATTVEIRWDRSCDGTAEVVPDLPLVPAGPDVQPTGDPSSPAAVPFDDYHLRLVDLTSEVLAGTTVPVTFEFEDAGRVTVDVPVRPSNVPPAMPTARCSPPSAETSRK
jgi:copper(I)-binding protein